MDKVTFIVYLMGDIENNLIADLPDGATEQEMIDKSEKIIVKHLEHVKQRIKETGGRNGTSRN